MNTPLSSSTPAAAMHEADPSTSQRDGGAARVSVRPSRAATRKRPFGDDMVLYDDATSSSSSPGEGGGDKKKAATSGTMSSSSSSEYSAGDDEASSEEDEDVSPRQGGGLRVSLLGRSRRGAGPPPPAGLPPHSKSSLLNYPISSSSMFTGLVDSRSSDPAATSGDQESDEDISPRDRRRGGSSSSDKGGGGGGESDVSSGESVSSESSVIDESSLPKVLECEIEKFLCRREATGGDAPGFEYLVKHAGRAYKHAVWVSEDYVTSNMSVINRRFKSFAKRGYMSAADFDRYRHSEIEEILMSSDDFRMMHRDYCVQWANRHKLDTQWFCVVLLYRLIGFTYNHVQYGHYFVRVPTPETGAWYYETKPTSSADQQEEETPPGEVIIPNDLSNVLCRLYLDMYSSAEECIKEVRQTLGGYRKALRTQGSEYADQLVSCRLLMYYCEAVLRHCAAIDGLPPPCSSDIVDEELESAVRPDIEVLLSNWKTWDFESDLQPIFLVSWRGVSHCDSTWETQEELLLSKKNHSNDDHHSHCLISKYRDIMGRTCNSVVDCRGIQLYASELQNLILRESYIYIKLAKGALKMQTNLCLAHKYSPDVGFKKWFHNVITKYFNPNYFPKLSDVSYATRFVLAKHTNLPYGGLPPPPGLLERIKDTSKPTPPENNKWAFEYSGASLVPEGPATLAIASPIAQQFEFMKMCSFCGLAGKPAFIPTTPDREPSSTVGEGTTIPPAPATFEVRPGMNLLSHQLTGVNWLVNLFYTGRNGILADEMGLGKTVQTIVFLNRLKCTESFEGPYLIVAPLSTLHQWRKLFEAWAPNLVAVSYHDEKGRMGRALIREYLFFKTVVIDESSGSGSLASFMNLSEAADSGDVAVIHVNSEFKRECWSLKRPRLSTTYHYKFDVLITSYETLSVESDILTVIPWTYVVIDEAHRLKNRLSRVLQNARRIPCRRVLLLTGTPIQNNSSELWALLNFIEPVKFCDFSAFTEEFGNMKDSAQLDRLTAVLRPHLLRRTKEDVMREIPSLEETIIDIELSYIQKAYYRAIYDKNRDFLTKFTRGLPSGTYTKMPSLANLMMELRKCCNHPFLISGVQEAELAGCSDQNAVMKKTIDASGKMILIDKLLPKLHSEKHKVLLFSQFTKMLDVLENYLEYKGWKYERLDGKVKSSQRAQSIDRFNHPESDMFVFLLSTKAGGIGINLTAADIIIIFDSDWNPHNDIQAVARAHRIGQTSNVKVYRLITNKTYEAEMLDRASLKLGLNVAMFSSAAFSDSMSVFSASEEPGSASDAEKSSVSGSGGAPTKSEVSMLLKKGLYGVLTEQDSSAIAKFRESDIDEILSNNSRVVTYQVSGQSSKLSKVSFLPTSEVSVDINDPEFWDLMLMEGDGRRLVQRLTDGSATKDEVSRQKFMNDLEYNVQTITTNENEEHVMNAISLVLESEELQFTEEQKKLVSTWKGDIQRKLEKKRRSPSGGGPPLQQHRKTVNPLTPAQLSGVMSSGDEAVDPDAELPSEGGSSEDKTTTRARRRGRKASSRRGRGKACSAVAAPRSRKTVPNSSSTPTLRKKKRDLSSASSSGETSSGVVRGSTTTTTRGGRVVGRSLSRNGESSGNLHTVSASSNPDEEEGEVGSDVSSRLRKRRRERGGIAAADNNNNIDCPSSSSFSKKRRRRGGKNG